MVRYRQAGPGQTTLGNYSRDVVKICTKPGAVRLSAKTARSRPRIALVPITTGVSATAFDPVSFVTRDQIG